jgi:hypothetical protein
VAIRIQRWKVFSLGRLLGNTKALALLSRGKFLSCVSAVPAGSKTNISMNWTEPSALLNTSVNFQRCDFARTGWERSSEARHAATRLRMAARRLRAWIQGVRDASAAPAR